MSGSWKKARENACAAKTRGRKQPVPRDPVPGQLAIGFDVTNSDGGLEGEGRWFVDDAGLDEVMGVLGGENAFPDEWRLDALDNRGWRIEVKGNAAPEAAARLAEVGSRKNRFEWSVWS
ncbi:hypothetical protein [Amycolatopsis sp. CA-230715]|uniref:hypothetical protein n=1 Tax=Amycolatopsis sp. CA-230715 TaxID=2745196 RepID=UPI001C027D69|nr:hypothetical protein [Amycolatopsis sp. CA-230715]QWF86076.1 hypothetical protein HUW46_09557 [Amycolatopsis sp. CA-230715]